MNNVLKNAIALAIVITAVGCKSQTSKNKLSMAIESKKPKTEIKNEKSMEKTGAFLEITLKIKKVNRPKAAGIYVKYKEAFLTKIDGATSKELLMRDEDVQVLHGFQNEAQATAYLKTALFTKDVVGELALLLTADPEIRIYTAAFLTNKQPLNTGAFLQISLKVAAVNRLKAGDVYSKYKTPFLTKIDGAVSKDLIKRTDDVQVLHGFETQEQAKAYLSSQLFTKDIVGELGPLLLEEPEIRIYSIFKQ
ncbi:MAG: hypothetical protein V3U92_03895 [Cellulophaga sp.]